MEDIKLKTITAAIALVACSSAPAFAGNGLDVNGAHYNLNIAGKAACAPVALTGSNRHVIEVLLNFNDGSQNGQAAATLDRTNKIFLSPGSDFQVTDGNACDKDGAGFTLPVAARSAGHAPLSALLSSRPTIGPAIWRIPMWRPRLVLATPG